MPHAPPILGAFAKLRKEIITFAMSVSSSVFLSFRPSVNPHGTTRYPPDVFYEISYWNISLTNVEKIQVSLKSDKNNGTSTWRQMYILIISLSVLLRMGNISDKSCKENQNIHLMVSNFFFRKSCTLWDKLEKYCRAGQASDDNMAP